MISKFGSSSLLAIVVLAIWFGGKASCDAAPAASPELTFTDYNHLNAMVREVLQMLEKVKSQPHHERLTGQVNSRSPRSGDLVGDMAHALRLYQLQELDRMYGSKARPRFGKRAEVTLDNVPTYGYDGNFNGMSVEDRR